MAGKGKGNAYSDSPSVSTIVGTLTERIRTGRYRDGRWFPTERELVEEFGVSRTIIRKAVEALEQRNLVMRSPRCRTVVQGVPVAEIPPRETKRRNLGLWIWPGPTDPAAASVVQGIYNALDHTAFRVVVGSPVGDYWKPINESEARFLESMADDQDIAGILLWYLGGDMNQPALQKVRAANIPMVFLDRRPPEGFDADFVGVDNLYAAEQVVRHLVRQGHRRIAHITNMDHVSTVAERLEGYRRALEAAEIPFRPELVLKETAPTRREQGDVFAGLVENLLALPGAPTAVFAVNDHVALHLIAALRARGVRVPEDIAVAGFDGVERWMPGAPFLTTALQPFERLGARAIDLLLQRIENDPAAAYQHILLDAPLSIHDSTRASH
jgi:LacI family transcriptional regulator